MSDAETAPADPPQTDRLKAGPIEHQLLWVLRIGVACCFAGWAWQHLYWEGPYHRILWDTDVFAFIEKWGISWDQIVGDGAGPGLIQTWTQRLGWFYAVLTIIALTVRRQSYAQMIALTIGSMLICGAAYCKYIAALRQPPMWIEHGGQFLIPLILISALICGVRNRITIGIALLAFCMTFGGHGAYALGWSPTPPHFLGMVVVILHVSHETALTFIRTAGILDMLVCICIFIPATRKPAALYAVIWGLLTALARPVSGMSTQSQYFGADQYIHEAIIRLPHVAIPLMLFLIFRQRAIGPNKLDGKLPLGET